jgi:hypothetical protein
MSGTAMLLRLSLLGLPEACPSGLPTALMPLMIANIFAPCQVKVISTYATVSKG